ncbi:hypothetical protein [Bacillus suaedae]|uniref:Lipoprotein n=1 Tax=Halalkalibacter suaedae TaxID=2822140 RepID=A0A940WT18_9BACI|nr:hypothetical protein [Bacillus suaedae]MBP3950117.1 hypothetical protein [Bacillus suaedae]
MNKLTIVIYFTFTIFMLVGCGNTAQETITDSPEDNASLPAKEANSNETDLATSKAEESEAANSSEVTVTSETDSPEKKSLNVSINDQGETLFQFSNEQIEYARVWLQLGPNQEIDELNIRFIRAGEPLNPEDETSANYPEDVIQLAGSRLVDGSVTYSGNGDGTINVYNVPLRWDGQYPAGEEFYREIIENTKLVEVDIGEDEAIIKLIKLQNVQN